MLNKRTIDLIIKKTQSRYMELRKFYILFIGPVIIGLIIYYFNRGIPIISLIRMLITYVIGSSFFLLLFLIIGSEARKSRSFKTIYLLISEIANDNWRSGRLLSYQNIMEIHPKVMKHPVSIYVFGFILSKEGYHNEGAELINKAKELNNNIDKIQSDDFLNQRDAQQLIDLLKFRN